MTGGSNWTFEALSRRAGGINAYINDQLSDESIYEDVDKLMKDHKTWHMWMNQYDMNDFPGCSGGTFLSVRFWCNFGHVYHHWNTHPTILPRFFPTHIASNSWCHLKQVGKAIRDKIMDTPFQKDFEEELKDARTDLHRHDGLTIFALCSCISIALSHIKGNADSSVCRMYWSPWSLNWRSAPRFGV